MFLCALVLDCALSLTVDRLGDRSYARREGAQQRLGAWGRLAIPHLHRAEAHPDPEVARRVAILLAPYAREIADARSYQILPSQWPRRPWLTLYNGSVSHFLTEGRSHVTATGAPDWPEYREATRLWVRSQLLQRRPVEEIRGELDRMAAEERWWILQHGANYNPPLKVPQMQAASR
jgi:hypothetical protein